MHKGTAYILVPPQYGLIGRSQTRSTQCGKGMYHSFLSFTPPRQHSVAKHQFNSSTGPHTSVQPWRYLASLPS